MSRFCLTKMETCSDISPFKKKNSCRRDSENNRALCNLGQLLPSSPHQCFAAEISVLKTCLADLPNNTEGGRKALFTILSVLSVSRQRNNRVVLHLSQIFLSTNEHVNSKSVILHHSNAGSLIWHGLGFNKGRTWDFQSLF